MDMLQRSSSLLDRRGCYRLTSETHPTHLTSGEFGMTAPEAFHTALLAAEAMSARGRLTRHTVAK